MKVLVADDDAELRELIAFTLSQAGYLVIKAGDGSAAVRLFAAEAPDLVVLDINMPARRSSARMRASSVRGLKGLVR